MPFKIVKSKYRFNRSYFAYKHLHKDCFSDLFKNEGSTNKDEKNFKNINCNKISIPSLVEARPPLITKGPLLFIDHSHLIVPDVPLFEPPSGSRWPAMVYDGSSWFLSISNVQSVTKFCPKLPLQCMVWNCGYLATSSAISSTL